MNWTDIADSSRTILPEIQITFRLLCACILGGAIGFERELKDHPAGLRTHMLTALAAALFTILALEFYEIAHSRSTDPNVDPIRVVEAVTAGVAFIAAGAIIQARGEVRGLTTGAGMWMAGAVGVACGSGFFVTALIAVVLAMVILALVKRLEKRLLQPENETASPKERSQTS